MDPPNNCEGENKRKRRKDVSEPSSISSRRNISLMIIVQDDTHAMQPLDEADTLIQKHSNPEWFPKKSGLAKRSTTWFDLLLKSDIDKDENHNLGPLIVAIAKKFKELVQKEELTIAYFKGAGLERLKVQYNNDVELEYHVSQLKATVLSKAQWNSDEGDVFKPRSFERHMSKSTKPHLCFYNNDYTYLVDLSTEEMYTTSITKHYAARYYKEGIEDRIPKRWSKEVHRYHFEALNDLKIKSVVCIDVKKKWGDGFLTLIIVKKSDDKEYEFSYAYLPRLSVNDVEDMYLPQNRDQEQGRRYSAWSGKLSRTLNLTKPTMFFKGIDQRIPFTMTATHKGVVYLTQYNIKSLMKLSEVKKSNNGTLVKIQENLIDMLSKNKMGSGNKRLKGRDYTNDDVKSSREILKKIDEVLKHKEQLRRLEEYVEGRPKTINPRTFVRPL
ncbi:hypothetical protein Tco_1228946 [Tanacetum coccineum]